MARQKRGLLYRLFVRLGIGGSGREASVSETSPVRDAADTPEAPNSELGTRFGHQPVLHEVLALHILNAHLRNRHQLLDPPPSDLRAADAEEARLLIRAMAAAAHADGDLDPVERGRIRAALHTSALGEEDRRALERAIEAPPCLETLVRQVASPRMAARFYAVSLAAVDKDAAVNRSYLRYLAHRLDLPADLVVRLNRRLGMRM